MTIPVTGVAGFTDCHSLKTLKVLNLGRNDKITL